MPGRPPPRRRGRGQRRSSITAIPCAVVTWRSLRGQDDRSARQSKALLASAAAIALAFLVLPHSIGWFGFVDGRLVPVATMLALLAIRPAALGRPLAVAYRYGPPVLAFAIVGIVLVASQRFQAEARGYREVLAEVPSGARLLNLPLDPDSDVFVAHPFVHYDKLVLVDRPIVVSDIWFHQGSALYPTAANPVLRLPAGYSESNLKSIDWAAYHLEDWSHVLIRTRPDRPAPTPPPGLELVRHAGGWWLYRAHGDLN